MGLKVALSEAMMVEETAVAATVACLVVATVVVGARAVVVVVMEMVVGVDEGLVEAGEISHDRNSHTTLCRSVRRGGCKLLSLQKWRDSYTQLKRTLACNRCHPIRVQRTPRGRRRTC